MATTDIRRRLFDKLLLHLESRRPRNANQIWTMGAFAERFYVQVGLPEALRPVAQGGLIDTSLGVIFAQPVAEAVRVRVSLLQDGDEALLPALGRPERAIPSALPDRAVAPSAWLDGSSLLDVLRAIAAARQQHDIVLAERRRQSLALAGLAYREVWPEGLPDVVAQQLLRIHELGPAQSVPALLYELKAEALLHPEAPAWLNRETGEWRLEALRPALAQRFNDLGVWLGGAWADEPWPPAGWTTIPERVQRSYLVKMLMAGRSQALAETPGQRLTAELALAWHDELGAWVDMLLAAEPSWAIRFLTTMALLRSVGEMGSEDGEQPRGRRGTNRAATILTAPGGELRRLQQERDKGWPGLRGALDPTWLPQSCRFYVFGKQPVGDVYAHVVDSAGGLGPEGFLGLDTRPGREPRAGRPRYPTFVGAVPHWTWLKLEVKKETIGWLRSAGERWKLFTLDLTSRRVNERTRAAAIDLWAALRDFLETYPELPMDADTARRLLDELAGLYAHSNVAQADVPIAPEAFRRPRAVGWDKLASDRDPDAPTRDTPISPKPGDCLTAARRLLADLLSDAPMVSLDELGPAEPDDPSLAARPSVVLPVADPDVRALSRLARSARALAQAFERAWLAEAAASRRQDAARDLAAVLSSLTLTPWLSPAGHLELAVCPEEIVASAEARFAAHREALGRGARLTLAPSTVALGAALAEPIAVLGETIRAGRAARAGALAAPGHEPDAVDLTFVMLDGEWRRCADDAERLAHGLPTALRLILEWAVTYGHDEVEPLASYVARG